MINPVIASWTDDDGTVYVEIGLPEPSYVDQSEGDGGQKGFGFDGGPAEKHLSEHGVYAYNGRVYDQYDGWSPNEARTIASWWLAAAAAAERDAT